MQSKSSFQFPRGRTLVHPGPFNPIRIHSKRSPTAQHIRLELEPGLSLFDALIRPLAAVGIESASCTILGGVFDDLQFCVAPPDPTKQAVIAYTTPVSAGRTYMVFGNATIGKALNRKPLVHCHAVIRRSDGWVKGGHIIAQASTVGPESISVLVTSLEGFELRATFDPETNIPAMQPQETSS